MEDLNRLKQLSGIRAKDKNIQQLNELNEAPKRQASPAPGPSQGYDDSPLGALRQYDAAKAAGTLPPITRAPSAPSGGSAPVKIVPTKGGDYPVYPKASPEAGSFRDAFASARAQQGAGGTFTWQGRSYSTNRADDKPATPAVRPITSPGTSSVPKAGAGMPAQPSAIGPSTGPTSRFGDPTSAPYGQLPPQPMNRTGVAPAPSTPTPNVSNLPTTSTTADAGEKAPSSGGAKIPDMISRGREPPAPAPAPAAPPPASGGGEFKDTVGRFPPGTPLPRTLGVPPAGAGMPAQGYARPAVAPGDMTFKSDLLSKQAKGDFSEEELEETFRTAYEAAMAEVDNSPIKYDPNKRDTSPISTGSGDNRPIPYNPSAGGSTPPGTVPYRAPPPPPATAMTGEKDTNPFSKPALEGDLTSIFGGGIKPLSRDEIIRQSGQYPGSTTDVTRVPPGAYTDNKGTSFQDRVNANANKTPIDLNDPKDNRPFTLAPPPDSTASDNPKIAAPSAPPVSGSTGPAVGTDSDGNRIIPYYPVPKDDIIQYVPSNNPFATQMEKDAYWASKALQKGQKPLPHEQSALDQINAHKKANKYESADKPDYIDADNDDALKALSSLRRLAGLTEADNDPKKQLQSKKKNATKSIKTDEPGAQTGPQAYVPQSTTVRTPDIEEPKANLPPLPPVKEPKPEPPHHGMMPLFNYPEGSPEAKAIRDLSPLDPRYPKATHFIHPDDTTGSTAVTYDKFSKQQDWNEPASEPYDPPEEYNPYDALTGGSYNDAEDDAKPNPNAEWLAKQSPEWKKAAAAGELDATGDAAWTNNDPVQGNPILQPSMIAKYGPNPRAADGAVVRPIIDPKDAHLYTPGSMQAAIKKAIDVLPASARGQVAERNGELNKVLTLAGLKETDIADEGNEFSGELAKAKAAHRDEFEVDGKTYKVKEEDMKTALKDKQRSDEALERLKMAAGIW